MVIQWRQIRPRKLVLLARLTVLLLTTAVIRRIVQESQTILRLKEEKTREKRDMHKKYRIKSSCPQCGCTGTTTLSEAELKKRYGDVPNIELECHECMMIMESDVQEEKPEK